MAVANTAVVLDNSVSALNTGGTKALTQRLLDFRIAEPCDQIFVTDLSVAKAGSEACNSREIAVQYKDRDASFKVVDDSPCVLSF